MCNNVITFGWLLRISVYGNIVRCSHRFLCLFVLGYHITSETCVALPLNRTMFTPSSTGLGGGLPLPPPLNPPLFQGHSRSPNSVPMKSPCDFGLVTNKKLHHISHRLPHIAEYWSNSRGWPVGRLCWMYIWPRHMASENYRHPFVRRFYRKILTSCAVYA